MFGRIDFLMWVFICLLFIRWGFRNAEWNELHLHRFRGVMQNLLTFSILSPSYDCRPRSGPWHLIKSERVYKFWVLQFLEPEHQGPLSFFCMRTGRLQNLVWCMLNTNIWLCAERVCMWSRFWISEYVLTLPYSLFIITKHEALATD